MLQQRVILYKKGKPRFSFRTFPINYVLFKKKNNAFGVGPFELFTLTMFF